MIDIAEHQRQVEAAVAFLKDRIDEPPQVLIQLGTGLGELAKAMQGATTLAYEEIPHFPRSTVTSHAGNLVIGRLAGQRTAILQGRFHSYEGYSAREVAFPIRVLALLGVKTAIITNASGGLNPAFCPRFPDLSTPYAPELRKLALSLAQRLGLTETTSGTYVCIPGPSLETPAETRFLRMIGADAVGMSSVPEILVALHAGLRVLGLSVVANVNDPDHFQPIILEEIIASAKRAEPRLQQLILHILAELTP